MNRRAGNFWLVLVVSMVAFGWLIAELFRVFFAVKSQSGMWATPFGGVIQHKIGELMVSVPFVAVLLMNNLWAQEKVLSLNRKTRIVMITGGLLDALAWYTLREKVGANSFLRIWCLVIFIFGLVGSSLLGWLVKRTKNEVEKSIV